MRRVLSKQTTVQQRADSKLKQCCKVRRVTPRTSQHHYSTTAEKWWCPVSISTAPQGETSRLPCTTKRGNTAREPCTCIIRRRGSINSYLRMMTGRRWSAHHRRRGWQPHTLCVSVRSSTLSCSRGYSRMTMHHHNTPVSTTAAMLLGVEGASSAAFLLPSSRPFHKRIDEPRDGVASSRRTISRASLAAHEIT